MISRSQYVQERRRESYRLKRSDGLFMRACRSNWTVMIQLWAWTAFDDFAILDLRWEWSRLCLLLTSCWDRIRPPYSNVCTTLHPAGVLNLQAFRARIVCPCCANRLINLHHLRRSANSPMVVSIQGWPRDLGESLPILGPVTNTVYGRIQNASPICVRMNAHPHDMAYSRAIRDSLKQPSKRLRVKVLWL